MLTEAVLICVAVSACIGIVYSSRNSRVPSRVPSRASELEFRTQAFQSWAPQTAYQEHTYVHHESEQSLSKRQREAINQSGFPINQTFQSWAPQTAYQERIYVHHESEQSLSKRQREAIKRFIVREVIPRAEGQKTSWQHVTLILLAQSETENLLTFQFKPSKNATLPIDSGKPFIPQKHEFNNYIVARPDQNIFSNHAEKIILDEFEDLLEAFRRKNKEHPSSIILYSWIMPCTTCTINIIHTLANRGFKVIVAYTIHYRYDIESKEQQEANRERLKQAGVMVQHIYYNKRLESN